MTLCCGLGLLLGACASDAPFVAGAFADPSANDLYDCKQLQPRRAALEAREKQLRDLMERAGQGPGGALISEVAYRSELVTVQGQRKYADEAWREKRCERPIGRDADPALSAHGLR